MSHPNDINLNTLEKMTSMKNMFGNSIIEILKPNIKSHQNESVIKMLEIAKDKPDNYMELLAVAIFHKNFEIIKYMVEKFNITENDSPFMSAISFYNSILPDNSEFKLNDSRENYNMIQCPFVIMSGIGGDVEIFKYLLKKKLISNLNETGIIALSKKLKNSVNSNIIGACCYYGKKELLEYLLKNHKFDLNLVTTEKKSKLGKVGFSKEYLGLTLPMLAVVGNNNDEITVNILKILKNYNAKFKGCDHNKDNILHLATRNKKINTVKYIVDELNLKELMNETNKDGFTPFSLAQNLNNEIFINYYSDKEKKEEQPVDEIIKELINESNIIKDKNNKKKKKKNKNQDEPSLLNSTEYEETLKEIKPSKTKNKKKNYNTYNDIEEEEYKEPKPKKNKKINDDDDNYQVGVNSEKLKALLEPPKPKKKKEKKENKVEINNDNKINKEKNEIKNEEKKIEVKEEQKEIKINKKPEELEEGFIIGLGSKNKKNKKLKKTKEEKEKENELKKEEEERIRLQQLEEEKRKKEEEERIQREKEIEEQKKLEELRKKEIEEEEREKERIRKLKEEEEREKERIRKLKEEEEKEKERIRKLKLKEEELKLKQKQEEEKRQNELRELQERQAKEKEKETEKKESSEEKEESEEEEDYSSEKNFLSENEDKKEKEKVTKYVSKEEYDNLNRKYIELDRRISCLEKEKEEMSTLLRNLFLQNKTNKQIPISANKEENINDLMTLANKELENKNNIIHNLEGKVSKLDLRNVKEFSNQQLKEYKDFYTKQLKVINDALKQY